MDPNIQAEIERQQSQLLEKLSTIFESKIDSMKRQLEDVSSKALESQMSELKRMRFAEPQSFKKKGHEQQYKHNEKVKTAVTEAKEAILARKQDACIMGNNPLGSFHHWPICYLVQHQVQSFQFPFLESGLRWYWRILSKLARGKQLSCAPTKPNCKGLEAFSDL